MPLGFRTVTLTAAIGTCLLASTTLGQLRPVFLDPALPGTTDFDAWDQLNRSNPQVASANPEFPSFTFSTSAWPEPIESALTEESDNGTPDNLFDDFFFVTDQTGDAAFDKVIPSGGVSGGYPAGESIYNSFNPGTFRVFDETLVSGTETVVFQLEIAPGVEDFGGPNQSNEFFLPLGRPVLNFNGGAQALVPLVDLEVGNSQPFNNPGPGPPQVFSVVFAFQWDLRGLGSVSEYEIIWSTVEFGTNYQMRLDSGDTFAVINPDAGDYDRDTDIDNDDYLTWVDAFGSTDVDSDGNSDGSVTAADYVVWRDLVLNSAAAGTSSAVVAGSIAIPEPTSLIILCVSLSALSGVCRAGKENRG